MAAKKSGSGGGDAAKRSSSVEPLVVDGLSLPAGEVRDDAPRAIAAAAAAASPDPRTTIIPTAEHIAAKEALWSLLAPRLVAAAVSPEGPTAPGLPGNIVGVGIGPKVTNGAFTPDLAVAVFVRKKLPMTAVAEAERVPPTINDVPTDVVEVPPFVAYDGPFVQMEQPAMCGVSVGHVQITAGTIGCLIPHETSDDACYILSNTHILANAGAAKQGDLIVQPGPVDPGPRQNLALLARFVPLQPMSPFGNGPQNTADAALAITRRNLVDPSFQGHFNIAPDTVDATPTLAVCKVGRTTGFTTGRIRYTNANVPVGYEIMQNGQVAQTFQALFVNQILIETDTALPFSQPGDSGSLIVTRGAFNPVGLLIAGPDPRQSTGSQFTIANQIGAVMQALNFSSFVTD